MTRDELNILADRYGVIIDWNAPLGFMDIFSNQERSASMQTDGTLAIKGDWDGYTNEQMTAVVLHELGHWVSGHCADIFRYQANILVAEAEAWLWAFDKGGHTDAMLKIASWAFGTYLDNLHEDTNAPQVVNLLNILGGNE